MASTSRRLDVAAVGASARREVVLELGAPFRDEPDRLLHGRAHRQLLDHLTDVADEAGCPSETAVVVRAVASPRALRVRVGGRLRPYPPSSLRRLWLLFAPQDRRDAPMDAPDQANGWLAAVSAEVASPADPLVRTICSGAIEAITGDLSWLVGEPTGGEEPREAGLRRALLGLGLGVGSEALAAARSSRVAGLDEDDLVELVADQLRPARIEVRANPETWSGILSSPGARGEDVTGPVREALLTQFGLRLPPIALVANPTMAPGLLTVRINDLTGALLPAVPSGHAVALGSADALRQRGLDARPVLHPISDVPLSLARVTQSRAAVLAGPSWTGPAFTALQVYAEVVRRMPWLVGTAATARELLLLADASGFEGAPDLVASVLAQRSCGAVTRLLRGLLEERCPITNLRGILQLVHEAETGDEAELLAHVRRGLGAQLSHRASNGTGVLQARSLDPDVERWIGGAFAGLGPGDGDPPTAEEAAEAVRDAVWDAVGAAEPFTLVTSDSCRRPVWTLLAGELPGLHVLAESEVQGVVVRRGPRVRMSGGPKR